MTLHEQVQISEVNKESCDIDIAHIVRELNYMPGIYTLFSCWNNMDTGHGGWIDFIDKNGKLSSYLKGIEVGREFEIKTNHTGQYQNSKNRRIKHSNLRISPNQQSKNKEIQEKNLLKAWNDFYSILVHYEATQLYQKH